MAAHPPCHSDPLILDCYPPFVAEPAEIHLEQLDTIADTVAQRFFTNSPVDFITIDGFAVKWQGFQDTAEMAERRAKLVEKELVRRLQAMGVVVENLHFLVRGMDVSKPRASNSSEHGRALNRRVEIMLSAPKGWLHATLPTPLQKKLQELRITHKKYKFDKPQPDNPPLNLTGTYAASYKPKDGRYKNNRVAVQINQAGRYLKLWYTRYRHVVQKTLDKRKATLTQSLRGNGSGGLKSSTKQAATFGYSIKGEERFAGSIDARLVHGGDRFNMRSGSWEWSFVRQSRTPQVSDRAIDALPDSRLKTETKIFRDHPFLEAEFRDVVIRFIYGSKRPDGSNDTLLGLIRRYIDRRSMPHVLKTAAAIEERFKSQVIAEIELVHIALVDRWLRNELGAQSPDGKRTYWEWLHLICVEHRGAMPIMRDWLSCTSRPTQQTFVYTWTFVGVGGGGDAGFFGGSYYRGNMVIERTRPKEGKWKKTYPAFVGGFSVGLSAGTQAGLKMAEGTLRSNYEWDQENFIGRFNLYEGSLLSINNPTGEHAVDKTTIEVIGDKKLPRLSGVAEQTTATGLGIGAGSAVLLGQIYADGSELAKKLKLVKAEDKKLPVNSAYGAAGQLHFDVDATTLTDDGRQLLREMLATHLAVFSNPESELRIDGHASPSGPSEHNTELSWIRAVNVLQAIDDILGHSFKIKPDNIIIWGWGEELSAKALGDKDVESAEWRKVDIRLDGKIAMTLRAP